VIARSFFHEAVQFLESFSDFRLSDEAVPPIVFPVDDLSVFSRRNIHLRRSTSQFLINFLFVVRTIGSYAFQLTIRFGEEDSRTSLLSWISFPVREGSLNLTGFGVQAPSEVFSTFSFYCTRVDEPSIRPSPKTFRPVDPSLMIGPLDFLGSNTICAPRVGKESSSGEP